MKLPLSSVMEKGKSAPIFCQVFSGEYLTKYLKRKHREKEVAADVISPKIAVDKPII
jgi:hypothetical protein